jgi:hypothetical protein
MSYDAVALGTVAVMRTFAALQLLVAAAIIVLAAVGALPWWSAAFPLLIAWLCGTQLPAYVVERRPPS